MTVGSDQFYLSKDGDVLDSIAWAHYGRQSEGVVEAILVCNPGLADLGPVYVAGIRIVLPDLPETTASEPVLLWG